MKLSNRITLLVSIVLVAIILGVSFSLLLYVKNATLSLSIEQVQRKQQNLRTSFSEMACFYARTDDSDAVHDSLIKLCFARFSDQYGVLLRDGTEMVSSVVVDPSAYVPSNSEAFSKGTPVAVTVRGRNLLIAGSHASVGGRSYDVYVVEDVTEVHSGIRRMAWIFAGVSVMAITFGAMAVTLLVRRSTKPITLLSDAAKEIADGAYEKRVEVRTKDEIGSLSEDFNRMADAVETKISELEECNERQRLFIGGVTHEFKTPLTGLLLHAGLLRWAYLSENERNASLEHIELQTAWLERLTQNLLKLTTSDDEIELQSIYIPDLLIEVKDGIEPKLNECGATLSVQCETKMLTLNPELIRSLLNNLIVNAANAYDADAVEKPITLTVSGKTFSVADRGRGIPKDAQSRLFEPFFRVDKSRSRKQGGSGLGLALVKAIADAHGADIIVDSEEGKGTTVSVTLP
ncbi:MAG: HAMP domain-containing histidine kinase [Clostridia bacterium]|nr:HAMP domain-containing histidine kinase [Clostridia bacterium]